MKSYYLFLSLFQPFAQFRNPFTFFYAQTFPLPPKSTILGLLENATGRYYSGYFNDLNISIWGYHSAIYWNYLHFIKGNPYLDNQGVIRAGDNKPVYGSNRSRRTPTHQQEIAGANFYIFLKGDNNKINEVYSMLNPVGKVLNLGRGEDTVFIREIKLLEMKEFYEKDLEDYYFAIGAYVKKDDKDDKTNETILKESTVIRLPVYSISLWQKFVYGGNEDESIKNREELLKNKSRLKRKVDFQPVYYVERKRVRLNTKINTLILKYNDRNFGEIRFYLNDLVWL